VPTVRLSLLVRAVAATANAFGAVGLGVVACGPGQGAASNPTREPRTDAAAATPPSSAAAADSVVLERTLCFGLCPAYRLSVAASGRVHFASLNPGETGRTASDTIPRAKAAQLLARAGQVGFFQLPDRTADDSSLCPLRATDHPTVVVAVFSSAGAKRVEDYTGCYVSTDPLRVAERLERVRAWQQSIDSVAGSSRWVRPARRN
jgi:hypothetical protein